MYQPVTGEVALPLEAYSPVASRDVAKFQFGQDLSRRTRTLARKPNTPKPPIPRTFSTMLECLGALQNDSKK